MSRAHVRLLIQGLVLRWNYPSQVSRGTAGLRMPYRVHAIVNMIIEIDQQHN